METGDSRIRCGVRVAEITTSWPSVDAGASLICTAEASFTTTSFASKPIELITSVAGSLVTVIRKLPAASVKVPWAPPLTVTETAWILSWFASLRTLPVMVTDWAKTDVMEKRKAVNHTAEKRKLSLINLFFVLDNSTIQFSHASLSTLQEIWAKNTHKALYLKNYFSWNE
jgi:hypothetical protein